MKKEKTKNKEREETRERMKMELGYLILFYFNFTSSSFPPSTLYFFIFTFHVPRCPLSFLSSVRTLRACRMHLRAARDRAFFPGLTKESRYAWQDRCESGEKESRLSMNTLE